MEHSKGQNKRESLRTLLRRVIFGTDTPAGRGFDVLLLWTIVVSVVVVSLGSVEVYGRRFGATLSVLEWCFTGLFTLEYLVRLYCALRPWRYAISFFGVVDLLSILPAYLSLLFPGAGSLLVFRALRLLRIFRILKLARYLSEGALLASAIWQTRRTIIVFIATVLTLVLIIGAIMYLIEGEANGFDSIPRGMYWAIVTLTTVGYGDISPQTPLGQIFASLVMILGYGIVAVPTGIVTVALSRAQDRRGRGERGRGETVAACPTCQRPGHDADAVYCKYCGRPLYALKPCTPPTPPAR
ncbi:MAG: ion transporter [Candidatus Competibacterales bacterium]